MVVVIVVVVLECDFLILKFYHDRLIDYYRCRLLSKLRLRKCALICLVRAVAVMLVPRSARGFHLRPGDLWTLGSFVECLVHVFEESGRIILRVIIVLGPFLLFIESLLNHVHVLVLGVPLFLLAHVIGLL